MTIQFCLVTHRMGAYIEDSDTDLDRKPDYQTINGTVKFAPNLPAGDAVKVYDEEGARSVPVGAITAEIVDGVLSHEGEPGVYLFAGGESANPSTIAYTATYSGLTAGGNPVSLRPARFEAVPGGVVDLADFQPIAGSPGVGVVQGPPGEKGEPGDWTLEDLSTVIGSRASSSVTTEITTQLPPKIDQLVPPKVAEAIAADRAVADAAAAAVHPLAQGAVDAAASDIKWVKRNLTADDDLRLLTSGTYGVASASVASSLGLPAAEVGTLEVHPVNANDTSRRILTWRSPASLSSGPIETWEAMRIDETTLTDWTRTDAGGVEVEAGDTIFRGLIPSDKTPDDYLKAEDLGWWHIDHDDSRIGTPFTERAAMEVLSIGSRRIQRVTEFSGRVWVRQGLPSAPGAWIRVDAAANAYFRGVIRAGEDLGDYRFPEHVGQWRLESGVLGLPTASLGVLENLAMNNSNVQRFTKYPDGETFVRTFSGVTPTPWKQIYPAVNSGTTPPHTVAVAGTKASGFKRIPLAVTLGRGTAGTMPLSQEVRYCIHYNAPITRWRLHVAARDSRTGNTVTGNVTFGDWTLGEEGAGGAYINPQTVIDGFSTDGQGWASDWINTSIPQDVPLLLGTSYTADAAPYTQIGACWTGDSEATLTQQQTAPFEVWIEAETYATTPVIAVLGSSSDTGVGGSRPVVDSTIGKYARAHHALPMHYANSGDSMSASLNPDAYKWTRWQDCDRPDAVLWALGSNDIHGANSVATMQAHHATVADILRDKVSDVLYGATVFQRANGEHPDRVPFNEWLETLPNGLRDVFDFSAAIGSPPDPSFDADGVHINDSGHDAILGTLTRPIVAPAPVYQA